MKNVTHVTFDMRIGGAEQVICNLIEHTNPSRFRVSVLCLERSLGPFGVCLKEKGYPITSLARKPGFDFNLIRHIRSYIVKNIVDVLHCHQYTPYVYGVLGAATTPCKVIFTEHGRFYPDRRKLKRVFVNPLLSLLTDHITAISSATRDALIQYENFPSNRIEIIYNGIEGSKFQLPEDPTLRKQFGIPPDAHVLGTVARMDPIKNQKLMLKALKILHKTHPQTYLILVGDGPERKNLEELASSLGLKSHVIFTGFRQDAHLFYSIMDVFLLTSFSEGTAMTLLESMAARLPCVVTDVGGNTEIVAHGITGYVVPNDDAISLSQTIHTLLRDSELREQFANEALQRFEERFVVGKMVAAYQAIYE